MSAQSVRARLRDVVKEILNTGTSPARTAASVALGIAVGLSPLVGFQTIVVIVAAFVLGLNRLAALLASCIFNPWTAFPIVVFQIHAGCFLLGRPLPTSRVAPTSFDLGTLAAAVQPSLEAYITGGILLAVVGGVVSYPAAYWGVCRVKGEAALPAELAATRTSDPA